MNKYAYYNDIDEFVCSWVEELIKEKLIPNGKVDCRSIVKVSAEDLRGFTQIHLFCGIAGWAQALKLARWSEHERVITVSAPCQPFSTAGKRKGVKDERHLWPEAFRLIKELRFPTVFGEQVAAAIGSASARAQGTPAWFDLVQRDLEGEGYGVGATIVGAHSVGAPHQRQRLYFVAESLQSASEWGARSVLRTQEEISSKRLKDGHITDGFADGGEDGGMEQSALQQVGVPGCAWEPGAASSGMGDTGIARLPQRICDRGVQRETLEPHQGEAIECGSDSSGMGNTEIHGHQGERILSDREPTQRTTQASPWHHLAWLPCIDGKLRPTQPSIFPLANGVPNRVGMLRGAGNAIVAPLAAEFIKAYLAARGDE